MGSMGVQCLPDTVAAKVFRSYLLALFPLFHSLPVFYFSLGLLLACISTLDRFHEASRLQDCLNLLEGIGDSVAKARFEREVVARWKSDFEPVQMYLSHGGFLNSLSPRALVDIFVHGGPQHLINNLLPRVDARTLIAAWDGQKSNAQLRIIEQFKQVIEQMDPPLQILLIAGCASITVGKALIRVVNVTRLPSSQLQALRENKRASRIIALAGTTKSQRYII